MTFYVNAWLDRVDPFISLHNRQTGEQVVRFDKQELQQCLEQGDFCLNELCNPCQQVQHELVKCLLLVRCSHEVSQQLESIYHSFLPRPQSAVIIPFRSKLTAVPTQRDCA